MTTNQEKAVEVIVANCTCDFCEVLADPGDPCPYCRRDATRVTQALADAQPPILIPDESRMQWMVQIGYRNSAGQTDIVEGIGDTKDAAVENAQDQRMLPTATEVVRGFAKRYITPWEAEGPIYTEQDKTNDQ